MPRARRLSVCGIFRPCVNTCVRKTRDFDAKLFKVKKAIFWTLKTRTGKGKPYGGYAGRKVMSRSWLT